MLCPHCYAEVPDDTYMCPGCGKKVEGPAHINTTGSKHYRESYEPAADRHPVSSMEAATRMFKDPGMGMKVLIGSALSLIPIFGSIVTFGFAVEYARRIIHRDRENTMPEWDDFGSLTMTGLMVFLGQLIYGCLFMLLALLISLPFMPTIISAFQQLMKTMDRNPDPQAAIAFFSAIFIPLSITILLVLLLSLVLWVLIVLYARNSNFLDLFNIGAALKLIFFNFIDFIVVVLVCALVIFVETIILGIVSTMLSFIPILGQIVIFVISMAVNFITVIIVMSVFAEFYYKNHTVADV